MTDAFADFREILDRALAAERGLSLKFETHGKAKNFVQKLNRFRRNERSESKLIYPPDHRMFGRSPWDGLMFIAADGDVHVIIERLSAEILEVKEL